MRAGGREVDVIAGSSVARTVVARGDGDRDAERGCGLACGVECGHRLRGPAGFRPAPADRNHARIVGRVVHRAADGIDEALVGIGCEVDNDLCPRGDGSRDFDIEHDLAIRAVRVAGRVLALVHRDSSYRGRRLAQSFEVGGEVRGAIAATQLDDADGLAGGRRTLGKLVKLAHLNRGVRGAGCAGVGAGEASRSARSGVDGGTQDTEVRLGLGTIIEPEDRLNRTGQLGGQMDAAFTNAIGVAVKNLLREGDAKGLLHGSDRSGELDGAALGLWRAFFDCQPELFRESAHQFDRRRIGGVLLAILGAREAVFAQAFGIERTLAPDDRQKR